MDTVFQVLKTKAVNLTKEEQHQLFESDTFISLNASAEMDRVVKSAFFDCLSQTDRCTPEEVWGYMELFAITVSKGVDNRYSYVRLCLELDVEDYIENLEREDQ